MNLHLYQSTFTHESRMLKITRTLAEHGVFDKILVVARHEEGLPFQETIDAKRAVRRLKTWIPRRGGLPGKILATLEWMFRVALFALFSPVRCVSCHSLMVLPIGVLLKLVRRTRLIYETHELETETGHLRGFRQRLARWTERLCIRWVDETIVVGDGIASWYRTTYPGLRVHTVRNLPYASTLELDKPANHFRNRFAIPENSLVFLYQGVLGAGRGIPLLLEAFSQLGESHHLVCMGYGEMEASIKEHSARVDNIHFHPAVAPHQLADFTPAADVGICLIERMCLSYYLSLPNKLFEYLQSGIPVVASNFPEMGAVINAAGCGWTTDVDLPSVINTLQAIDLSAVQAKQSGVFAARTSLTWEQEEARLLSVYGPPRRIRFSESKSVAPPQAA